MEGMVEERGRELIAGSCVAGKAFHSLSPLYVTQHVSVSSVKVSVTVEILTSSYKPSKNISLSLEKIPVPCMWCGQLVMRGKSSDGDSLLSMACHVCNTSMSELWW